MSNRKIYITGGAGFIGSNLVARLNTVGIKPIVIDNVLDKSERWKNLAGLNFELIPIDLVDEKNEGMIVFKEEDIVIHLAANVDTKAKMDKDLWQLNVEGTVALAAMAKEEGFKLIYASSAAVYGAESEDFTEDQPILMPLNPYGFSKLCADQEIITNEFFKDSRIYGLRFFNVYGPRETYKGDMKSVVTKAVFKEYCIYESNHYPQGGEAIPNCYSLFESHRPDFQHGEQKRDFVYVEDVCSVIEYLIFHDPKSGIYNVGSGLARTFNDLIYAVDPKANIIYKEMPKEIRNQYQYFTQANLEKLRSIGYTKEFTSLEEGVAKTKQFYYNESPYDSWRIAERTSSPLSRQS